MLSIHPDALIWNQSYVFFSQNYDEWGQKIFKLCFQPKNAKNMPILGVLHITFKRDGLDLHNLDNFV